MLRLMCESSAVWVLVEESICRIPEEGTRTQEVVLTLRAGLAHRVWSAPLGLSASLSFVEGARTISFTAFITWFLCIEKILKRTGVFF